MSDRERIRRPEPARTSPVRSLSAAFHTGDGPVGVEPLFAASSSASHASHAPSGGAGSAWSGDDPVSRAVRASCDVVEKAVRRGFGLGRDPSGGTASPWAAWAGGPLAGPWTTGQWVDAMTSAAAQWTQWFDAWSTMARSMMTGAGPGNGAGPGDPPGGAGTASRPTLAAAHAATGALRVTVELRSARAASVELDLTGEPPPGAALEVHGLLAPPAAGAPPITDVTVTVVHSRHSGHGGHGHGHASSGGITNALGSIDQHPAGSYAGAVLAAGRACGTLTVRLT